jgi:hypothetical protein
LGCKGKAGRNSKGKFQAIAFSNLFMPIEEVQIHLNGSVAMGPTVDMGPNSHSLGGHLMKRRPGVFALMIRATMMVALCLGFAASLRAEFLVPDQEYRCPPSDHTCKSPHNLSSIETRTTGRGNTFTINFVEYNDKGRLWNPIELSDALSQVRQARGANSSEGVLLVVYIHGWQNNADETPGSCDDVCRFRDTLLARLADSQASNGKPLKVVGIYRAWRGLTFTVEPFKHVISYWPRRGVARHVGQTGMFDAVNQIEKVVGESRKNYLVVFTGHSFGARVLENAAETRDKRHVGFMAEYRNKQKTMAQIHGKFAAPMPQEEFALNPGLPADLIVYVNAATASTVTRKTIKDTQETCKKTPGAPICGADPLYLAVTSHADLATGIIMPIANLVFPALTSDGLHLFSAANTPWLHTHTDPVAGCSPGSSVCFDVITHEKLTVESLQRVSHNWELPGKANDPFWIFNVKKDVMNSHGDVWNESVTDLVTKVIVGHSKFEMLSAHPNELIAHVK